MSSSEPSPHPDRRRVVRNVLGWVVAATLAVAVGLFAVTSVGATLRGRGPIGTDAAEFVERADQVEGDARPDPADPVLTEAFTGAYGTFEVACQGPFASEVAIRPAPGWRVVSFEEGPDDDLDAVLADGTRSVTLEVFCNQGRPALADREIDTLPEGPGDGTDAP